MPANQSLDSIIQTGKIVDLARYIRKHPKWYDEKFLSISVVHYAAQYSNLEMFREVASLYGEAKSLSLFEVLTIKNDLGEQPIHYAAKGKVAIVDYLLTQGISLETFSLKGTPLHYAVSSSAKAICRFLIDQGANLDASVSQRLPPYKTTLENQGDNFILTLFKPFSDALEAGEVAVIQQYLAQNATWLAINTDTLPLEKAVQSGQFQAFIEAYENLASEQQAALRLKDRLSQRCKPKNSWLPAGSIADLWVQAGYHKIDELKWMKQRGAQLNGSQDEKDNTLIHLCVYAQNYTVLKAILSGEIDVQFDICAKNRDGLNALDIAASNCDLDALKILTESSEISEATILAAFGHMSVYKFRQQDQLPQLIDAIKSNEGESNENRYALLVRVISLWNAVEDNNIKLAKQLVDEKKTPINGVDADGNTLLHNAKSLPMVHWLVAKGLSLTALNKSGQLPEVTARRSGGDSAIDAYKRSLLNYVLGETPSQPEHFTKGWIALDYVLSSDRGGVTTLLHAAAACNNVQALKAMKQILGDDWYVAINRQAWHQTEEKQKLTPLGAAVYSRREEAVAYLLENDANPLISCVIDSSVSTLPCTPFQFAVLLGHNNLIELFFSKASDRIAINGRFDVEFKAFNFELGAYEPVIVNDLTPLVAAIKVGHIEKCFEQDMAKGEPEFKYNLVEFLVRKGADVSIFREVKQHDGNTAMCWPPFCMDNQSNVTYQPLLRLYSSFIKCIHQGVPKKIIAFLDEWNPTWLGVPHQDIGALDIVERIIEDAILPREGSGVNYLVESKQAEVGLNSIHIIIRNKKNTVAILKTLLKKYSDVVTPLLTAPDRTSQKRTPLHHAARVGNLAALKWLLAQESVQDKVNQPDDEGNTVFHLAVKSGSESTVDYLLTRNDVDQTIKNKQGNTAETLYAGFGKKNILATITRSFRIAIEEDNLKQVALLYNKNASLFDGNPEARLKLAAEKGACQVFQFLAEKSDDNKLVERWINHPGEKQRCLVHHIARKRYTRLIQWYARQGADFERLSGDNDFCFSPLAIAIDKGCKAMVSALIADAHCDVNTYISTQLKRYQGGVDSAPLRCNKPTPLILALYKSNTPERNDIVDALLSAGASTRAVVSYMNLFLGRRGSVVHLSDCINDKYSCYYLRIKLHWIFTIVKQLHTVFSHRAAFKTLLSDDTSLAAFYPQISALFGTLASSIEAIQDLPKNDLLCLDRNNPVYDYLLKIPKDRLIEFMRSVENKYHEYLSIKEMLLKEKLNESLKQFILLIEKGDDNSRWRKVYCNVVVLVEKAKNTTQSVLDLSNKNDEILSYVNQVLSFRRDERQPVDKQNFRYSDLSPQDVTAIINNVNTILEELPKLEAEIKRVISNLFEGATEAKLEAVTTKTVFLTTLEAAVNDLNRAMPVTKKLTAEQQMQLKSFKEAFERSFMLSISLFINDRLIKFNKTRCSQYSVNQLTGYIEKVKTLSSQLTDAQQSYSRQASFT